MNSDSKPNSFEEEARVLIEKQEEFKAKIIAERSMYMARIIELDELLAKLGGVKKYKPRQKVNEGENGGEASAPLDDEEEAILAMDYLDSNGALLPIPENNCCFSIICGMVKKSYPSPL